MAERQDVAFSDGHINEVLTQYTVKQICRREREKKKTGLDFIKRIFPKRCVESAEHYQ